jgi:glutathione peroxidase
MTLDRTIAPMMFLAALIFPAGVGAGCPTVLDHRMNTLLGKPADLCEYQGKVVLVVNTASYCGYTPQYKGLEALYERYRDRGLVVLGFPSNDFGGQEPGSNQDVADFCERTYKVTFPMVEKSSVAGATANPVFRELAAATGETPKWNFHKYLISRNASVIKSFSTKVTPESPDFIVQIEELLSPKSQ